MRYRIKRDLTRALLAESSSTQWKKTSICYWCGKKVDYHARPSEPHRATKEHLVPLSKGGPQSGPNVVVACRACNSQRGNDTTWVPHHLKMAPPREVEHFASAIKGVSCEHIWSEPMRARKRRWYRRCLLGCGKVMKG